MKKVVAVFLFVFTSLPLFSQYMTIKFDYSNKENQELKLNNNYNIFIVCFDEKNAIHSIIIPVTTFDTAFVYIPSDIKKRTLFFKHGDEIFVEELSYSSLDSMMVYMEFCIKPFDLSKVSNVKKIRTIKHSKKTPFVIYDTVKKYKSFDYTICTSTSGSELLSANDLLQVHSSLILFPRTFEHFYFPDHVNLRKYFRKSNTLLNFILKKYKNKIKYSTWTPNTK